MPATYRRSRYLVDRRLQLGLLTWAAVYWLYCLLMIVFVALGRIFLYTQPTSSGEMFAQLRDDLGLAVVGSLAGLPIVLWDCLRRSHRFAGPMVRVREALGQLARGQVPPPVELREGDHWRDVAAELNRLIQRQAALGPSTEAESGKDSGEDSGGRSPAQGAAEPFEELVV